VDGALAGIRVIHFAATIVVGGTILFRRLILEPALMGSGGTPPLAAERALRAIGWLFWAGFALAMASWGAWLLGVAAKIAQLPIAEVLFDETAGTLLTETRFGHAWTTRLVIGVLIVVGTIVFDRRNARQPLGWRLASILLAVCFLGSLASSGHAGAEEGIAGQIHWSADFVHLVAAGAWLGSLSPLALVLAAARTATDPPALTLATRITHRFSVFGIASVASVAITGLINALYLVGSVPALIGTPYGRLLVAKIAVFAAMLGIAAVNRFGLTPRLPEPTAIRDLSRTALLEAGLGLLILAIVGVLGMVPPGLHVHHIH
jgi:putative copper resistance protein D